MKNNDNVQNNMQEKSIKKRVLVVGATGLVGSQVVRILDQKGYNVRAMVRKKNQRVSNVSDRVEHFVGDLRDPNSLRRAVSGMEVVVSSANGIIPQSKGINAKGINDAYDSFISICEEEGVSRFIQSSVPVHAIESTVPELAGKRRIEKRLERSSLQYYSVRNPAFMDIWLVMSGFAQAENSDPHATTQRDFGFMKLWKWLVGDFAAKYGFMIAPGGARHGGVFISTRDVAQMMSACVWHDGKESLTIESGGPEWISWKQVAKLAAVKLGRRKVRVIPLPSFVPHMLQIVTKPFSPSIANVMGLIRFVALWQPKWDSKPTVEMLGLPPQQSVGDYISTHFSPSKSTKKKPTTEVNQQVMEGATR